MERRTTSGDNQRNTSQSSGPQLKLNLDRLSRMLNNESFIAEEKNQSVTNQSMLEQISKQMVSDGNEATRSATSRNRIKGDGEIVVKEYNTQEFANRKKTSKHSSKNSQTNILNKSKSAHSFKNLKKRKNSASA